MRYSEPPPLDAATRSGTVALLVGVVLALIGLFLWNATVNNLAAEWDFDLYVPPIVGYLAASLFVDAAGLISAGIVVFGRLQAAAAAEQSVAAVADTEATIDSGGKKRLAQRLPRLDLASGSLAGWPHACAAILLGVFALAAVISSWGIDDPRSLSAETQQVFGGLLILLAFPFLVLERVYASTPPHVLPDAPQLERLSRVPLASFVGLGIASVLLSLGFVWPSFVERAIGIFIGLVSLEVVLRGLAIVFVPFAPIDARRSVADSTIASLLRLSPPTFASVGTAVKRQFGIDLSRSWALAFVRRAALPITLGMAVFAWCLTGVTALSINERAVYERLGVPVSVLGPGLHVHLPWPFGIMRSVELGVVHEIPIIISSRGDENRRVDAADQVQQQAGVEDPPPASADRLWDQTHPSEASYLVASGSQGKQSFHIVNVDLRIVYRVGLSDAAAIDSAYAVANPEALIRAITGKLLVRYFARYTLLDVLGQSRERFTNDFHDELQARLQELPTGIDVIAVVVEAIHPPPGAANAYHNVQAAEILAQSQISLHRADAIGTVKKAQQTAAQAVNDATAAAAELVDQAKAESVLFAGDRQAYHQDGQVFLFEQWLDRLSTSLAKSSYIVIDHRLRGLTAPTIDLRGFDLPGPVNQATPTAPSSSAGTPSPPPAQGSTGGDEEGDRD